MPPVAAGGGAGAALGGGPVTAEAVDITVDVAHDDEARAGARLVQIEDRRRALPRVPGGLPLRPLLLAREQDLHEVLLVERPVRFDRESCWAEVAVLCCTFSRIA